MTSVIRRRLALFLASVLVAVVALLCVRPAVASPDVDCGPLDQAACDWAVADIIAAHRQGWEERLEDQLPCAGW
jgi:hypothetical protein